MEFVILNTLSQHRLSTESSIVWVNHSSEQLIYGKSHVNLFFFLFFFLDGVTVNPNITKQEGIAFCAKTLCFYWLGWPRANTQYALYSNAGVKSRSFISTPSKYVFTEILYFVFFLTENIQALETSIFSWWFLTSPVLTYRYKRHFRTSRET